jgi:hypothetical protein
MTTTLTPSPAQPTAEPEHNPGFLVEWLASFHGCSGERQILALALEDGAMLVIDTPTLSLAGARLLARLAPEEPRENARLVADMYLAEQPGEPCRLLTLDDFDRTREVVAPIDLAGLSTPLLDLDGGRFRIQIIDSHKGVRELRWTHAGAGGEWEPLTLRCVYAAVEAYEPARSQTLAAIASSEALGVSSCTLRSELDRVDSGATVLNRGLREALLRTLREGEVSMSQIALRCGRSKRDGRGNVSGETSWLSRRLGLMPDSNGGKVSPWVDPDVLALIARAGLGLAPHEVEV